MSAKFPFIWIHIKVKATSMVIFGLYRPWITRAKESYIKIQEEQRGGSLPRVGRL